MNAILHAIRKGDRELALFLIQHSLPFQINHYDEQGQTALHVAVQKNYLDIVKVLLERGANINAFASDTSYTHMTALHYAALTGNIAATRLLLAWGANATLENGRFHTAATIAYQHNFVEVARAIERHNNPKRYSFTFMVPPGNQYSPRPFSKNSSTAAHELLARLELKRIKENNVVDFMEYKKKKQLKN